MPVEYNLSHDETVSGWDEIIETTKERFKQVTDSFKNHYIRKDGISTVDDIFVIDWFTNQIHCELNSVIGLQEIGGEDSVNISYNSILSYFQNIIVNCILALHILNNPEDPFIPIHDPDYVWQKQIDINRALMIEKNKNYGSSWSIMRPEGITDVIHTKIHRVISLTEGEENKFESVKDSFEDIINYCVFCIMRMELEQK